MSRCGTCPSPCPRQMFGRAHDSYLDRCLSVARCCPLFDSPSPITDPCLVRGMVLTRLQQPRRTLYCAHVDCGPTTEDADFEAPLSRRQGSIQLEQLWHQHPVEVYRAERGSVPSCPRADFRPQHRSKSHGERHCLCGIWNRSWRKRKRKRKRRRGPCLIDFNLRFDARLEWFWPESSWRILRWAVAYRPFPNVPQWWRRICARWAPEWPLVSLDLGTWYTAYR